jgi:hypothetical protein
MQDLTQSLGHDDESHDDETDESAEEERQDEKNLIFVSACGLPRPGLEAMEPRRGFCGRRGVFHSWRPVVLSRGDRLKSRRRIPPSLHIPEMVTRFVVQSN